MSRSSRDIKRQLIALDLRGTAGYGLKDDTMYWSCSLVATATVNILPRGLFFFK
jgi:hypothetical protein